jgi:hypothetical protein
MNDTTTHTVTQEQLRSLAGQIAEIIELAEKALEALPEGDD